MKADVRLSVPPYQRTPPRELTTQERAALIAVADTLIAPSGDLSAPSRTPGYEQWLDRALAARRDMFDAITESAIRLTSADTLPVAVRELARSGPAEFSALSSVLAGAYLMVPEVRQAIGYPGQERKHPRFDEAADEIMDGILDPVIQRGSIYTVV
jgi:hypothetical protein